MNKYINKISWKNNNVVHSLNVPVVNLANDVIVKQGDRGSLQGFSRSDTLTNSQTITVDSKDDINIDTNGSVTLTFTPAEINVRSVKVISLKASTLTTLQIVGATWANNGKAPVWGKPGEYLVITAAFIHGRVVLNIFDNTQK